MKAPCSNCAGFGTIPIAHVGSYYADSYLYDETCPECDGEAEVEVLCPCCDEPVDDFGFCRSCQEPTVPYTRISFDTDPVTGNPRVAA